MRCWEARASVYGVIPVGLGVAKQNQVPSLTAHSQLRLQRETPAGRKSSVTVQRHCGRGGGGGRPDCSQFPSGACCGRDRGAHLALRPHAGAGCVEALSSHSAQSLRLTEQGTRRRGCTFLTRLFAAAAKRNILHSAKALNREGPCMVGMRTVDTDSSVPLGVAALSLSS